MYWFLALLAVVVVGVAVLVYQGRLGGMPPQIDDRPGPDMPEEAMTGQDVRGLAFAVVARGYAMDQVDAVLERLAGQLDGEPPAPNSDYVEWAGLSQAWAVSPLEESPIEGAEAAPVEAVAEPMPAEGGSAPGAPGEPF